MGRWCVLDLKMRHELARDVGYVDDVLAGTADAPWLWWAAALVVILGLLVLGMKLLGLFPE